MTESQSPQSQPEPNEPQPQRRFKRLPLILGVGVLVGVGGATLWTWRFVDRELVPLVTRQLSKTLNRPIQIGEIDRFSLTGVRLGASAIPATPTDTDRGTIEAVEVKFNPLQFLWTRRLGLRVILIKPTIYIEQDAKGAWVTTQIKKSEKKGWFEIALDRLEFDNGTVNLSSPNWEPKTDNLEIQKPEKENTQKNGKPEKTAQKKLEMTTLRRVQGSVDIVDNNDRVQFDVIGYPISKGRLRVKGEYLVSKQDVKLNLSGQDIPAAEISPVLTQTPLEFSTGQLYGNVGLQFKIGQAKILPKLEGNARFENLNLQLQGVPQLLSKGKGKMRFSQSAMLLEEANANYGKIPVQVPQGIIDFQKGYELPVKVPPADVALVLETLQLETPVPVTGEAEAVLKVLGLLNAPVLIGQAQTTDVATIDRVPFSDVSGKFAFSVADGTIEIGDIKATPEAGGEVEGIVKIALPPKPEDLKAEGRGQKAEEKEEKKEQSLTPNLKVEGNLKAEGRGQKAEEKEEKKEQSPTPNSKPQTEPEIVAQFVAREVPGDAIAQLYGTALPNGISLGLVNAKSITMGTTGKLETQVLWEALTGTYPAKGTMQIAGTTVLFQNTQIQVEDSIVRAGGIVTPENWQVALDLNKTPISPFLPPDNIQLQSLNLGLVTGQIQLAGAMGAFDLNRIQGLGQIELDAAGGNLQIAGQLANGKWEAQVAGNQVEIAQFLPPSQTLPFPLGTASGRFDVRGSSLAFDANTLEAKGEALVNVAGGGVQTNITLADGRWQADVSRFELLLAPFIPSGTLPEDAKAAGSGTFLGNLAGFDLASIQGNTDVTVAFANGGVQGRVKLANGLWQADVAQFQLPLTPFIPAGTLPEDAQAVGRGTFAGSLTAFDLNSVQANALVGVTFANGIAEGTVNLTDGLWNADVSQYQISLAPFIPTGTLPGDAIASGKGTFLGNLAGFDLASVQGNTDVTVAFANGGVQGRVNLTDGLWNANVSRFQVPLSPFLPANMLPSDAQAVGSGTFAGNLSSFDLASVQANANTIVTFADNKGARGTVNLADGRWNANVEEFLIPLAPFVPLGTLPGDAIASGKGTFAGRVDAFDVASLQANAEVGVVFKGGGAEGAVRLADNRWSANFDRLQVPLNSYLSPDLPLSVGTLVKLGEKPLTVAGAVNGFAPGNLTADGIVGFQVEGGEAMIDGNFDRGNWNAQVAARQLPVASLFPRESLEALTRKQVALDLQGELAGSATLAGTLTDFTSEAIAAALNPSIVREGGLQLNDLKLNDSTFDPVLSGPLQQTPNGLVVAVAGQEGSIIGERDRLSVLFESQAQPGQAWSYFPLEFQGDFDWKGEQGIDCAEWGRPNPPAPFPETEGGVPSPSRGEDEASESPSPSRVGEGSVPADRNCQGRSIALEEQTYPVQISGRRNGDRLQVTLNNLPLSPFDLKPPASSGLRPPITGAISTDITWDLARGMGSGSIQLDRPTIGLLAANSIASQFQYTGNSLLLRDTALSKGESEYLLSGRVDNFAKDPQFDGEVKISQGHIQDVLAAMQWFDIDDFSRGVQPPESSEADELELYPVGIPEASLFAQLRRFSEIQALLKQQQAQQETEHPLPRLTELQGNFNGTIRAQGSIATGADVNFDLAGDAWQWGEYQANQIIAKGSFMDGILALQPLNVRAHLGQETETFLSFAGQVGGDRQSGQFTLSNFPSAVLEKFVQFPGGVSISGNLNASATLAGSSVNPQARGELTLVEGLLNGEPIDSGRGSFLYSDSRLNFSSQVFVEGTEPIKVTGSLPYQFPGSTFLPTNETFNFTASVQNEGLALLNFLTDAVVWKGGQGQANITIAGERIRSGDPENPTLTYLPQTTKGEIALTDAEIASPNLPENLTAVTGTATLEGDRLIVNDIQGKFRQGKVTAQGVYPLFGFPLLPDDSQSPLTVTMTELALDVKGRYRGGIDGKIVIRGSQLNPMIGGQIFLHNGQILLPDQTTATTVSQPTESENPFQPIYNNLDLILGEKIQILKPPVLNFIADGKLTVNGTIDAPSAAGTIFLKQGLVNIFTTEFTLDGDYKNMATFIPEQGLDPNLSVLMRASVPEASHSPLSQDATATSSEIEELAIERGTVETVRIEAKIDGPASQLANNLQLSSSPDRNEREIIALMGGGFINTLGTGDSTLALANLAGSVLLTQFQTALNQALGLRDFRLFPTTTSRTSSLTLGAELGIKLTDNVSGSILRILDANQPTRFGVRYRIDDNILLRGSTDFQEDTRGEIELRFRF